MALITGDLVEEGAIVDLLVGVSARRRALLEKHGFAVPQKISLRAAIDTGSFITGMAPSVFQRLGIEPIDCIRVATPSTRRDSPHYADQFDVSLSLVSAMTEWPLPSVYVISAHTFDEDRGAQAIIGRDVVDRCVFSYHGPHRSFSLAF